MLNSRSRELKTNDYIYINPTQRHLGWKCGKIITKTGSVQIQVCYKYNNKEYKYWTHLDNTSEIREFKYNVNQLIIDGDIKKLFMFIPNVINQLITLYCGDNLYKDILMKPIIYIHSIRCKSVILNIKRNDDDITKYKIVYQENKFNMKNEIDINCIDIFMHKEIDYKLKGLKPGTKYKIFLESKSFSKIINFKTPYSMKQINNLNELIICGFIRKHEKHNKLLLVMPPKICAFIVSFCGNERILISIPVISVKSIYPDSVVLHITNVVNNNNIEIKYNSNTDNKWNMIEVNNGHNHIDYKIKGLNECTNYLISVSSINKYNIYGISSNILKVETNQWIFDVITNGYDDCIQNNGKTFVMKRDGERCNNYTTYQVVGGYSKGFNEGIHTFKIRCHWNNGYNAFCIVDDDGFQSFINIGTGCNGFHYYYENYSGRICTPNHRNGVNSKQAQKWMKYEYEDEMNQIIICTLNCDEWTLCFEINKSFIYKINIEKNKTYHPCISSMDKGNKFMIL